jgi:hypothetical protein
MKLSWPSCVNVSILMLLHFFKALLQGIEFDTLPDHPEWLLREAELLQEAAPLVKLEATSSSKASLFLLLYIP